MKGYELAEGLDKGILSKEQRVSGAGYFYCTIGFILKEVGTNFLFKDFEIIEEQQDIDIQSIEEVNHYNICSVNRLKTEENINDELSKSSLVINKLVQAVKQLDKKMEEKNNGIK